MHWCIISEMCDDDEDEEPLSECEAQPIVAEVHNYSPVP